MMYCVAVALIVSGCFHDQLVTILQPTVLCNVVISIVSVLYILNSVEIL